MCSAGWHQCPSPSICHIYFSLSSGSFLSVDLLSHQEQYIMPMYRNKYLLFGRACVKETKRKECVHNHEFVSKINHHQYKNLKGNQDCPPPVTHLLFLGL